MQNLRELVIFSSVSLNIATLVKFKIHKHWEILYIKQRLVL